MRTFVMIILSAITFVLHVTVAPMLTVFGAKIDFIMINVLLIGIFSKKWYPTVLSAVYLGLLVDITTQYGTYINTWVYLFFGIVVAVMCYLIKQSQIQTSVISVFATVCAQHFLYSFILYIMRLSESFTLATFVHGIPSAIYTAIISIGLYYLYRFIFSLQFMQIKKEDEGKYYI